MEKEKIVVILLVVSIIFSALAVVMNIAVMSKTNDSMGFYVGGPVSTNYNNYQTISGPVGGQIGLDLIKRAP